MNIYIDEAGSFVQSPSSGSWNTVCAFVVPETSRTSVEKIMRQLKSATPDATASNEVKLRDVSEDVYKKFLSSIASTRTMTFLVAADAGKESVESTTAHQKIQADKFRARVSLMNHSEGVESLEKIANDIENMPGQLYLQMICQFELVEELLRRSILFLQSRAPKSLQKFRWRIDQKDINKTEYERIFEMLLPAMLQAKCMDEPLMQFDWVGRDALSRFEFAEGEKPTWMKDQYGIEVGDALDVRKMMREDMQFVDSKSSFGVQVADLLASGARRLLRGDFEDNTAIARELSKSILAPLKADSSPIGLLSLAQQTNVDEKASGAIAAMRSLSRPAL